MSGSPRQPGTYSFPHMCAGDTARETVFGADKGLNINDSIRPLRNLRGWLKYHDQMIRLRVKQTHA